MLEPGTPIPMREKALAFTTAMTVGEFMDFASSYGPIIRRRYEEIRLQPSDQIFFATFPEALHFLMIVTAEDPDTVAMLPVVQTIVESSPRFDLRLLTDEDDLSCLDPLVEDMVLADNLDEYDLPLLLMFDEEWQLRGQWGPRPQAAESYLEGWLEQHPEYDSLADSDTEADQAAYGDLMNRLVHRMRVWYNSGLNQACIGEIRELVAGVAEEDDVGEESRAA